MESRKTLRLWSAGAFIAIVSACITLQPEASEEKNSATPAVKPCDCPKLELPGLIIGEVEYSLVGSDGPLQKARIDTGATTTSVGYNDLTRFESDGEKWIKFTIKDRIDGQVYTFERPLVRTAKIKRHNAEPTRRPVVNLPITIGTVTRTIEVTLADRDAFDYPVLIGRNFMDGKVLVDVSQRFIATDAREHIALL